MDLDDLEERWRRMLAQAEHFIQVEQCVDALGRARLCLREVEDALTKATDPQAQSRLKKMRARAQRHVELCKEAHDAWCAKVEKRAAAFEDNEARKYHAPLPVEGID